MSFKIVYANGCSHTFGDELGETLHLSEEMKDRDYCERRNSLLESLPPSKREDIEDFRTEHGFAYLVGKHFSAEVVNVGYRAKSNDSIVSSTIADISKLLERYEPSEILVIVQWTYFQRYSVWDDVYATTRDIMPPIVPNDFIYARAVYLKTHNKHFWDDKHAAKRMLEQIVLLESFLKARGIEYVMFEFYPLISEARSAEYDLILAREDNKYLLSLVNTGNWLFQTEPTPVVRQLRCGHACAETQELWARAVIDNLRKRNIIR